MPNTVDGRAAATAAIGLRSDQTWMGPGSSARYSIKNTENCRKVHVDFQYIKGQSGIFKLQLKFGPGLTIALVRRRGIGPYASTRFLRSCRELAWL
jgi:hypothetical protein